MGFDGESMPKETLTREYIKKDLNKLYIHDMLLNLVVIILSLSALLLITSISLDYLSFFLVMLFLILSIIFILEFVTAIFIIRNIYLILKNKFRIVTDTLIGIDEKRDSKILIRLSFLFSKPYTLHFKSYGSCAIHDIEYYKWSEMYRMWDDGIINYSKIDDVFYLVSIGKNNLICYNTKLFNLQEK